MKWIFRRMCNSNFVSLLTLKSPGVEDPTRSGGKMLELKAPPYAELVPSPPNPPPLANPSLGPEEPYATPPTPPDPAAEPTLAFAPPPPVVFPPALLALPVSSLSESKQY